MKMGMGKGDIGFYATFDRFAEIPFDTNRFELGDQRASQTSRCSNDAKNGIFSTCRPVGIQPTPYRNRAATAVDVCCIAIAAIVICQLRGECPGKDER